MIIKVVALALLFPAISSAACIPFAQAQKYIGETQCVTGKVLRVEAGSRGVHYLDFCADYRSCPFSVVVFSYDLKNVGDVHQLAGKTVEIRGEVKEYDGRAEIILENARQLGGEAVRLAPLPKSFDVEQKGHFSAGKFRASKRPATHGKNAIGDAAGRSTGRCGVGLGSPSERQELLTAEIAKNAAKDAKRPALNKALAQFIELI